MAQHILVTEYNPLWADMFHSEAELIKNILSENCVEIHHIGSTSVVGLIAKPIIDIMPVVHSLDDVDNVAAEFEKIGYEYMASSVFQAGVIFARVEMSERIKYTFLQKKVCTILNGTWR